MPKNFFIGQNIAIIISPLNVTKRERRKDWVNYKGGLIREFDLSFLGSVRLRGICGDTEGGRKVV